MEGMLRVDYAKWGQTPDEFRIFAWQAVHRRTRERFLALYEICQGKSATLVAQQLERHDETIHDWVHLTGSSAGRGKGSDQPNWRTRGGSSTQ